VKVLTVAGTRPEFIRLALVFRRLAAAGIEHYLVHTGQNFDTRLSDIFFEELEIEPPRTHLGITSDRVGDQIGRIIEGSERIMLEERPDALLILGDTNSGLSAVAAAHHNIPIFHMEAGNRCFDWSVPEEKNRKLIDHISTWLLPYTMRSREYLLREGIAPDRILVSGNPITEIVEHYRPRWEASDVLERLELHRDGYVLVTAHRKETVDIPSRLRVICDGLDMVARELDVPVVWSVHPRTRGKLSDLGITLDPRVQLHEPFGFSDFVALEASARCVVTDSGTVQEECSLLRVPAVTCRDTTERPETVECGSNVLSGVARPERILECVAVMVAGARDWESPYEGPLNRNVADKVVKFIVSNSP
jgi:UDP-N-acetylglucosamine 2-epimerase (non-hydrolysing)